MVCLTSIMTAAHSAYFQQNAEGIMRDRHTESWFRCSYTNLSHIFFHMEEQLASLAEQLAKVM